jgi:circadian clock protein KaiC
MARRLLPSSILLTPTTIVNAPDPEAACAIDFDPTGVPGLDDVLRGGLPRGQLYLLEGSAGAGKTTLGLQFLLEGVRRGERVLWCTLSETEAQLVATANSHGWDLSGVEIVNLTQGGDSSGMTDSAYSFFSPADIELNDIAKSILELIETRRPRRVVFDPFSDVRLLARDPLRYRRQVLQLREHLARLGATVLLIQEQGLEPPSDPAAEGVVHGIIGLYQHAPEYGRPRRRLRIHKLRGLNYREGFHDVVLRTGGLAVFPRLIAAEHALPPDRSVVSSGLPELDTMLGGGLDRGTSLIIIGPSGAGKSTLGTQFACAAAARGERCAYYLFDETERAFRARAEALQMPLRDDDAEPGQVDVRQIDPAEFSPGEFAHDVRSAVDNGARLIVIDSINGYLTGMPDESHLPMHLHELLTFLALRNVVTILTLNQHGLVSSDPHSPVEVSYLADSTLLIRYFEAAGAVRRAASLLKRRFGAHEVLIREMKIHPPGIHLGQPLREFRGVLTGQPDYTGPHAELAGSPG